VDLVDRNEPRQLRLDLLDDHPCSRGHDGDPRQPVGAVDLGHGQALDIVAAPGKQPDDAGQHSRLVIDEDGDGVSLEIGHARISNENHALLRDRLLGLVLGAEQHLVVGRARRDHRVTILCLIDHDIEDHGAIDRQHLADRRIDFGRALDP
jgi:hypothetical protein